MDPNPTPGLGTAPQAEWPAPPPRGVPAIDLLAPGTDTHSRVLSYLVWRIEESERKMGNMYQRWRAAETRFQAYIDQKDAERVLKAMNEDGKPPQVISITIPYAYASINTIVTYLLHTLCGRKPIFQVGTYNGDHAQNARNAETILQYQADHTRLVKQLYQFLQDTQVYGVGVLRTRWEVTRRKRTMEQTFSQWNFFGMLTGNGSMKTRQEQIVYEGNIVESIDPFMFFPDPRVPMTQVNRCGEYVFWRQYQGRHTLLQQQAQGNYRWVENIGVQLPLSKTTDTSSGQSRRSLVAGGDAVPGTAQSGVQQQNFIQVDQGTCTIIPRELGLGESTVPEKWLFTIGNKSQIIQAEPLDLDHDMHPVAVAEPYVQGYGFGNNSLMDYLGPIQDTISWFINSKIYNVRAALNNMFVVDPSMVDMADLRNPEPGKLIRTKRAAYGVDVRTVLHQFQVSDVTQNHVQSVELMLQMGQLLSAASENMMGQQEMGGRKTATEVRLSGQMATSRLAAQSRLISAQAITDLTDQMMSNTLQFLSPNFEFNLLGADGAKAPIKVADITGDFFYPVHDGNLPLDKIAMLDVWKEILMGVAGDPELRQSYSFPKLFEYVAELGGAGNIESFRLNVQPDAVVQQQAAAGNIVPIGQQAPLTPPAGAVG